MQAVIKLPFNPQEAVQSLKTKIQRKISNLAQRPAAFKSILMISQASEKCEMYF